MRSVSFVAIGTFAYNALAQGTAMFDGMTWDSVTVGQIWPIHWTAGDGTPVSLFIGNTTWTVPIFSKLMQQSRQDGSRD